MGNIGCEKQTMATNFLQAESYYAEAISLPMYPAVSEEQHDQVVAAVKMALQE